MVEIIIGISCFAFVVTVMVTNIIKRKKGKYCTGDCSRCSSCNGSKDK